MKGSLYILVAFLMAAPVVQAIGLAEAIAEAHQNSPDAKLSAQRIQAAEAAVQQADALLFPKFSLFSRYYRSDNPLSVFGAALNQRSFGPTLDFNNVADADNLNIGAKVTLPLYTGGQIPAGKQAAREQLQADTQMLQAVRNHLGYEVTKVYLTIQKTRAFVEAAESAVKSFEQNLGIAQKRLETGKALRADVLDIEVRLAQAREDLLQARQANELSRRVLANLLGREAGEGDTLPEPGQDAPALDIPGDSNKPARPELDALGNRQTAAEAVVESARGGKRPQVGAFLSAEHNRGWEFDGDGKNYTAGVVVDWNVWDGELTEAKVKEAQANADMVGEQQRRLRLAIGLEVQQARLKLQSATERVSVTTKAVELAKESVELTRVRFEQGLALATQLIDSETALTGARVRLAQAEADRLIAIAGLRNALGLPQL
jgi:outer membrane protein